MRRPLARHQAAAEAAESKQAHLTAPAFLISMLVARWHRPFLLEVTQETAAQAQALCSQHRLKRLARLCPMLFLRYKMQLNTSAARQHKRSTALLCNNTAPHSIKGAAQASCSQHRWKRLARSSSGSGSRRHGSACRVQHNPRMAQRALQATGGPGGRVARHNRVQTAVEPVPQALRKRKCAKATQAGAQLSWRRQQWSYQKLLVAPCCASTTMRGVLLTCRRRQWAVEENRAGLTARQLVLTRCRWAAHRQVEAFIVPTASVASR